MKTVCKFGGSSVANANQFKKIKSIVEQDSSRRIVITSAVGKDSDNEEKVTDLLFLLYAHLEYGVDFKNTLTSILNRFVKIRDDLKIDYDIENEIIELSKMLDKKIQKDYLVSRGEYYTANMLAIYLGYDFVDATEIIALNYDGTVNYQKTEEQLVVVLKKHNKLVIPGYYAKSPNGLIRLFPRGGSDLTGSIVSKAIKADKYENWTDVSGIYVANPKIIDSPKKIKNITYAELRELSYRGANVLHQETVIPLEKLGIPINIKNTNEPDEFGTLISNEIKDSEYLITGIAGERNFTSLNIIKTSTKPITMVLKDVLNLFIRYKLNVEHIPTGIDTLSVITKSDQIKDLYFDLVNEIRQIDGVVDLSLENDIALLAIVGRNMSHIPGVAGKIFACLGEKNINIKVIAQASTEISIILGVSNDDYEEACKALYDRFY